MVSKSSRAETFCNAMQGSSEDGYKQVSNQQPVYLPNAQKTLHRSPFQELDIGARPAEKRFGGVRPAQKENIPKTFQTQAATALGVGPSMRRCKSQSQRSALSGGNSQNVHSAHTAKKATAASKAMPAWLKEKLDQLGDVPMLDTGNDSFSGLSSELTALSGGSHVIRREGSAALQPQQSGSFTSASHSAWGRQMQGQQTSRSGNGQVCGGNLQHSYEQQSSQCQPAKSLQAHTAEQLEWQNAAKSRQGNAIQRQDMVRMHQVDITNRGSCHLQQLSATQGLSAHPSASSQYSRQAWECQQQSSAPHSKQFPHGFAMCGDREGLQSNHAYERHRQQNVPESALQGDRGCFDRGLNQAHPPSSRGEQCSEQFNLQPGYSLLLNTNLSQEGNR